MFTLSFRFLFIFLFVVRYHVFFLSTPPKHSVLLYFRVGVSQANVSSFFFFSTSQVQDNAKGFIWKHHHIPGDASAILYGARDSQFGTLHRCLQDQQQQQQTKECPLPIRPREFTPSGWRRRDAQTASSSAPPPRQGGEDELRRSQCQHPHLPHRHPFSQDLWTLPYGIRRTFTLHIRSPFDALCPTTTTTATAAATTTAPTTATATTAVTANPTDERDVLQHGPPTCSSQQQQQLPQQQRSLSDVHLQRRLW